MLPGTTLHFVPLLDASVSPLPVFLAVVSAFLAWSFCLGFYNVYLHPLAQFPGPRLAAASKYWLFYQEIIRGISLSNIRDDLHAQYGAPSFVPPPTATRHLMRHPNGVDTDMSLPIDCR